MSKRAVDVTAVRIFALVGHRSAGKTSLGDLLLQATGVTRTIGRVDEGSSLLDHLAEERRRKLSLRASFAWMDWEGYLLQVVDTPGSEGLAHERGLALACVDGAVVVVSAPDGLELGAVRVLEECARAGLARMAVLNRMDRDADVPGVLAAIEAASGGARVVPVQLPLVDEGRFVGVIDLFDRRALRYDPDGGGTFSREPIPAALEGEVASAWELLVEAVALSDDALLEQYLEDLDLPLQDVRRGLARAVAAGRVLPVAFASAATAVGAHALLDLVAWALPSPASRRRPWAVDLEGGDVRLDPDGGFVAQVLATQLDDDNEPYHVLRVWSGEPPRRGGWVHGESGRVVKVQKLYQLRGPRAANARYTGPGALLATWDALGGRPGDTWTDGPRLVVGVPPQPPPMVAWLLTPATKRDGVRLPDALATLQSLDAALDVYTDELTGLPVLAGAADDHLQRAVLLLKDRLGVKVRARVPPVGYRETPSGSVSGAVGVHRKVSDGQVVEFGEVELALAPAAHDELRFVGEASPDDLPDRFWPAVERGIRQGMRQGPTAGYPVVGVFARCTGGAYDILQSTDEHLVAAGERAFRVAIEQAGTRLLEPWWRVEVSVPADDVGLVIAELSARRGRIQGLAMDGPEATVHADCPYRELRTFGARLQAVSGGRGRYSGRPSHYDALPAGLVREAIAESPFRSD